MSTNYESPKARQLRLMRQILSLEGPLLTKDQKADVLQVTESSNIIDGFERIDHWKLWNKSHYSVPPTSPK